MSGLSATWQSIQGVGTLSTTRDGGVSKPPFDSLNLGLHVGDNSQDVLTNRAHVNSYIPNPAVWLNQVHSADVIRVDEGFDFNQTLTGDALYTQLYNQPLAIMTADCLPILLTSSDGQEVAAIHAGWRGLAQGIINNTVSYFKHAPTNLHAWLGPAIGADQFEVGQEVVATFTANNPALHDAFKPQNNDKYLADIYHIARILLNQRGVVNISGGEYCTFSQKNQFFSYRRDGQTGRMASLIWRK
ncbi:peptidoglycan editing factor PgeF [Pseudoalteromonas sp. 2CM39R]|uniref:peptidoglycan editing factor PgeF n=1 Tax=Pseudoalteromonas sp. 2CM39R TaxID=2929856 RepID=UPI0020C12195|nr:peptidoglycan editing factor PgeF [Pseudoalteromonas sp. 2CM39R]MCK8126833.1 peptidoglycan editing factor PgeF [Pseudoalteromonas sp. 2CM39R]